MTNAGDGRATLLMLRALGLGDFLTALPAYRALARAFPDHRKVLAAPRYLESLAMLTGALDEVVDAAPLAPLDHSLGGAEIAVNLHGRGPKSHGVLLALHPQRLLAFAHPDVPETRGFPEWRAGEHEVRRWCRLVEEFGIPADPSELDLAAPSISAPPRGAGATIIHPGSKEEGRRWPPERWAEVVRAEAAQGRPILLTGSAEEEPLARRIAADAGLSSDAVLAGQTDLVELVALVASAGMVVSGDTGIAHLATALGTPSVVLFGRIPPSEWGPPADRPIHHAIWKPEGLDEAADPADFLAAIQPEDVLRAIKGVARRGGSRHRDEDNARLYEPGGRPLTVAHKGDRTR